MPTLVYSPGVRAYIETARSGLVDVTEDIVSGNVTRNTGAQPSTFNLSISNRGRKYDRLFAPNDRITIFLKRLYWLQSLSGYLTSTPYFNAKPGQISLSGACTLKYLQHFHWDPHTVASQQLLNGLPANSVPGDPSGIPNAVERVKLLLTEVAEWGEDRIHIGNIPPDWEDFVGNVVEDVRQDQDSIPSVGSLSSGTVGSASNLGITHPDASTSGNPAIGVFLETEGACSYFGGPEDASTRGNNPALTGSERAGVGASGYEGWKDVWYCALRIPTQQWGNQNSTAQGGSLRASNITKSQQTEARRWWYDRKILVTNPANGKQLVARVVDIGPNVRTGKDIDLSKVGLEALGAVTGNRLRWTFASDDATPGPVTLSQQQQTDVVRGSVRGTLKLPSPIPDGANPRGADFAWGDAGNGRIPVSQMTRLDISGLTTYLHPLAAESFMQMRSAAAKDGITIKPKGNRSAYRTYDEQVAMKSEYGANAARPGTSNHGWGFAVDMANLNDGDFNTPTYLWLRDNGYRYGWVNPVWARNNDGRQEEPWHWEFWGVFGAHGRAATRDQSGNTSYQIDIRVGQFDDLGNGLPTDPNIGGGIGGSPITPTGSAPGGGLPTDGDSGLFATEDWVVNSLNEDLSAIGPMLHSNDKPLLPDITQLVSAAGRDFSSAPNGDFIGWFPDYFGIHDYAAIMDLVLMEVGDFSVDWSDVRLKTHFFVTGALGPGGAGPGLTGNISDPTVARQLSRGVASLEYPTLLKVLLGTEDDAALADTARLLKRFGVRPERQQMDNILGPDAEFYIAVSNFMQNWASQFSAKLPLSGFMPEVYPGMLVRVEDLNFQAYVSSVSHSFDFNGGMGGGFKTSLSIVAPSRLDGGGLLGAALDASRELSGVGAPPTRGTSAGDLDV